MKRPALLILCLLLSHSALATKDRVYRWTDKDGVVHYSQTEPARQGVEVFEVRRSKEPAVVAPPPPPPAAPPVASSNAETNAANCAMAKANAQLLSGKDSVLMDKDGDGKMDPLSDAERKSTTAETELQIATFCTEK